MKKVRFLVCISLLLGGCAALTPAGQLVRVTVNPDVVRGCEFVGNVKAGSGLGGPAYGSLGEDQVQIKMQNQTADLGGDVLFLTSNEGAGFRRSSRGVGEAYRCSTSQETALK